MLNKIKLGLVALLLPLVAFAQGYPSPTFNNLTVQGTFTLSGGLPPASLAAQAANTVLANVTASSASPTAVALPSCSTANSALKYTSATGFSCGTTYALTSGTLAQFAATTSAQLLGIISDETGSGSLVFATSPTLAGTPLAPTAAAGTNTTQIATTAFVQGINTGRLLNVQTFTSSGTYTPTTGTASVIVEVQAPGGGGGGVSATGAGQVAQAQSGAGGSYAKVRVTSGFSGATITVGTIGTGGTAGSNAGTSGGTTSFGTFASCPGGVGGAGSAAVTPPTMQSGAASPAACTIAGATTLVSTAGGNGLYSVATSATVLVQAMGGISPMGMGAGVGSGSGGNGAAIAQSTGATAGSNATAGKIIVYEYD